MIISKDEIQTFIPTHPPQFVILGTMGSINARTLRGVKPEQAFFYNSNRNHFWKVLQLTLDPKTVPKTLSLEEKRQFLNHWKIAMANIVDQMEVHPENSDDPSDDILFEAFKNGRLHFKKESQEFKDILKVKPLFFTCRSKSPLRNLIEGYLKFNSLNLAIHEKIWFLPTPTRCNPRNRSVIWKNEIDEHLHSFRSV